MTQEGEAEDAGQIGRTVEARLAGRDDLQRSRDVRIEKSLFIRISNSKFQARISTELKLRHMPLGGCPIAFFRLHFIGTLYVEEQTRSKEYQHLRLSA